MSQPPGGFELKRCQISQGGDAWGDGRGVRCQSDGLSTGYVRERKLNLLFLPECFIGESYSFQDIEIELTLNANLHFWEFHTVPLEPQMSFWDE